MCGRRGGRGGMGDECECVCVCVCVSVSGCGWSHECT